MSLRSALLALVLTLLGCQEHAARPDPIRIDSVRQIWEQPSELRVSGDGFPAGMHGEVLLAGTLYAPGAEPAQHVLRVPCRALSGTLAVIDLQTSEVAALPAGPFAGTLEVRFGSAQIAGLTGRVARAVFRLSAAPTPIATQFALEQRAQAFQRALGIEALELGDQGVVVAELAAEGPARAAGLASGDQIALLDGAPVQLPVDVLGRGARAHAELGVRSGRGAELRRLRVELDAAPAGADFALWALCCALGASTTALLARAFGAEPAPRASRKERWLAALSALSLAAVLMLLLEATAPALRDALRAASAGALLGGFGVYLSRRAHRTLRTTRDPALTPFL
jgi:PDZ domain